MNSKNEKIESNKNNKKINLFGEENKLILYKSIRILVYCLLLLSIILINISSGLFPSSSIDIKSHLEISDFNFGLFFLFSSLGKIIGSLLFFTLKNINSKKILLIAITLINSAICFGFFFSKNFFIFSLLKLIIGITDMLIQIYTPMWIQQFGFNKYKLGLTSLIQFCNPLGKCFAFLINYYLSWLFIFKIIGIIFSLIFLCFLVIPNKYSAKNILIIIENETGEEMYDKRTNVAMYTFNDYNDDSSEKAFPLIDKSNNNEKENDLNMNLNINELIEQNGNKKILHSYKIPFSTKIKIILTNKIFMLSLTIRVILIGIETTISLWIPDILIKLIEIEKNSNLNLFGNILIIITPPLGSFITRMRGPFTIAGTKRKRNTTVLLIFFYILSILIAILIPEEKSFTFIATIIIFLFSSATCLPMLQGICLSSISKKVKENILSFIHIFTLFFSVGFMPTIFGFFYDIKEKNKIQVVKYFLYIFLGLGFLLLPFLIFLIYRQDFIEERSSYKSKGFSIEVNSKNGGEGIFEELGNAYAEDLPNFKKNKKAKLKTIDI